MTKRPLLSAISSHSSLTLWLIEHRAEFAASLAAAGRPSWKRIALAMADLGLRDGNGNKPTPDAVYAAWKRLQAKPSAKATRLAYAAPKPAYAAPKPASATEPTPEAAASLARIQATIARRSAR